MAAPQPKRRVPGNLPDPAEHTLVPTRRDHARFWSWSGIRCGLPAPRLAAQLGVRLPTLSPQPNQLLDHKTELIQASTTLSQRPHPRCHLTRSQTVDQVYPLLSARQDSSSAIT